MITMFFAYSSTYGATAHTTTKIVAMRDVIKRRSAGDKEARVASVKMTGPEHYKFICGLKEAN